MIWSMLFLLSATFGVAQDTRFYVKYAVSDSRPALSATPDPRQIEIDRLSTILNDEKDNERRSHLNQQIWDLELSLLQEKVKRLYREWKNEADPKKKRKSSAELSDAAIASDQPQFVNEIATEGKFAEKEIKITGKTKSVQLREMKSFPPEKTQYSDHPAWVIRRVTSDRFELWRPHHGWLFDAKCNLVNEARPPRRDGFGRQWYGAFLPDGRWVTTDLWDTDCTLHFFSSRGKWLKDIAADKLVPRPGEDARDEPSLIGWCRCTRDGKGFVLSVGANGGRGRAWVGARGNYRVLTERESPWKLCYRRDLEPKGNYTSLSVPNDTGSEQLNRYEASHGPHVGFPEYSWSDKDIRKTIPDGGTFGFWPNSSNIFVVTEQYSAIENGDGTTDNGPVSRHTWFYHADGSFAGWINAGRLGDAAKPDGMLFLDEHGRVVNVGMNFAVRSIEQFRWVDGKPATAHKIFPDLRLGFFERGNELVLARW